ncbi:MAG: GSCFA domain-containing protein [Verrucomicrobiaceae bacterium]
MFRLFKKKEKKGKLAVLGHEGNDLERLVFAQGEDIPRRANGTWYRGEHTNFIASKKNLAEKDAVQKYILKGWEPERPFITKQDVITAFGSCFAEHITNHLHCRGYNIMARNLSVHSHVIRFGEGMVNTYAIRQQFEWAYENKSFSDDLWHDSSGRIVEYNERVRAETQKIFEETEVFILTLGLSEVWHNKKTGEVFWRAIPKDQFNPDVHGFRVTTVEENLQNLAEIYGIIRKHRPSSTIVITLSPVPLVATFRPVSCMTANSVSKAILRVAVDELIRMHQGDKKLFYFPSYEIVKEYIKDPYEDDNRHVRKEVVKTIMTTFEHAYCVG